MEKESGHRIIFAGKFGREDLGVRVGGNKWKTEDPLLLVEIESWRDKLERGEIWNGEIFGLEGVSFGEKLEIELNTCEYIEVRAVDVGKYARVLEFGTKPCGIVLVALVVSEDKRLILGRRSPQTNIGNEEQLWGAFGGLFNKDELKEGEYSPFEMIDKEIEEELGLCREQFETRLLAGVVSERYRNVVFVFVANAKVKLDEIRQIFELKGNKSEHKEVEGYNWRRDEMEFEKGGSRLNLTSSTEVGLWVARRLASRDAWVWKV